MAYTVTLNKKTVHGDQRCHQYLIAADGATEIIATGLNFIDGVATAPKSMASSPFSVSANEGLAGTAIAGSIGVTGVASGDDFYMTVWGR